MCAFVTSASAGVAQVRKQVEVSLLATGAIDIEQDGTVSAHVLDQPDKLPPAVVELLGKVIPQWRFEPVEVDGKLVKARTRMTVRVAARKQDDSSYEIRVNSASFSGNQDNEAGDVIAVDGKMAPPRYPMEAVMAGIQGTVYLVLKIDRQGRVEEVVEEQTNLTWLGNEREMEQARSILARAAKSAARKWRYKPPTRGKQADNPHWSARVPVDFALCKSHLDCGPAKPEPYGVWQAYVPGPKNAVPWISDDDNRQSPDALVAGSAYPVGAGPRLLTRLDEG
ncbi:MAG: energy transducer TonB [Pseudomonadota bacterium]|nr:energy transducer TonB [Pseudomonadota bacterium]